MKKKSGLIAALLILFWAVGLRFPAFGHPNIFIDEDWYLYMGGKLLYGYLPYIDIWDRKPFGLFLLYAPFHIFEQYRFLAYQITGLLFVWATALFVFKIARHFASFTASLLTAFLYLALLNCFSGFGGQTAVFYNFFTAWAFYLVINRFEEIKINPLSLSITGMQAMLLIGLGIEIKPTVIFEGIYLGCFLLLTCWLSQKNWKRFFCNGVIWVFMAMLPTLAIIAFYMKIGHFDEWYFANILSIFQKTPLFPLPSLIRLSACFAIFASLLLFVLAVNFRKFLLIERRYFYFVTGWAVTAFTAIALTPPFYSYYFLSFALAFSVFCAFFWSSHFSAKFIFLIGLGISVGIGEYTLFKNLDIYPRTEYAKLQKLMEKSKNACLFEYGATVSYLELTPYMQHHCNLTKYSFPSHLGDPAETGALDADNEVAELAHILDQKPEFILIGAKAINPPFRSPAFNAKHDLMYRTLKERYHLIYHSQTRSAGHLFELYQQNAPQT